MEELWRKLTEKGLYTKSFDEFQKQYNNPDGAAKLHAGLVDRKLYTKSKEDFTDQYGFLGPNENEVPTTPDLDRDGVNVDSYVNSTFWDSTGLDRDSYFDEEGQLVDLNAGLPNTVPDLGYDQILKELETKRAVTRDAVMTEETEAEGMFEVTRDDEADISSAAQSTYDTHVQQEDLFNNMPEEVVGTNASYENLVTDILRGNFPTPRDLDSKVYTTKVLTVDTFKEYLRTDRGKAWSEKNAGNYGEYSGLISKLTDKDFMLDSELEDQHDINKRTYFNQKLTIAKRKWLKDTGYDMDSPEGRKLLEKLDTVTLADIESDVIGTAGSGTRTLASIFNSIPNDNPQFKQAVLDTEERAERNAVVRSQASGLAVALDDEEGVTGFSGYGTGASYGATLLFDWVFGDSKAKEEVSGTSNADFQKIEETARKKNIEAGLIHEQYNRVYAKLTKTAASLKEIGDPRDKVEAIKSKYDLTTNDGIKSANKEITKFIDGYTSLVKEYNSETSAIQDVTLAATQIKEEMGQLAIREQDLGAFTDQLGKNHRLATQMSHAFANATVDLVQGAADFVYMVNPLGALADELIDYAGEDSYLGTVVETARIIAAPMTGGISLYSGQRRDDVKGAIDGYQEHVSSLVAEPPRYSDIETTGDAVEWALIAGATQAPQLALLAATGGTAGLVMMGAISAGQKFSSMEDQRELFEKTGGLYGQDHNFATMYAASLASGAVEALSEKVTLGLMKGGGGIASNALFGDIGKSSATNFFRRNIFNGSKLKYASRKLIDIGEEGGSEALATIGGNYIDRLAGDKTVNMLSGVEESFVTGALIGSTISMPSVFRDIHSSFKSVEAADVLDANFIKIQEQNAIMNRAEEDSPEYKAAFELTQMLVAQNAEAIAIDVKRVDSLTDPEKKRLVEIETENRKLVQQALDISQSDATQADKDKQINALNEVYGRNLNEKNNVISQYGADDVVRAHKLELERLQDQSDAIEAEGGAAINVTRGQSKTDEGLVVEFDAWKKQAQKKGNVRIAASEDGTQVYGAMVPVLNKAGEVTSYEMFFNEKNIFEDGKTTTASHELLHAAVFNTIRANPVLRRRFGESIERILDGPGVKINEKARKDLERVKQYSKTARGEEIFAIVSENMVNGNITIDGGALGKMKDLMRRTSMSTTDTDIEFNDDKDVRDFLKDYSRSRAKGINDKRITSLFVNGAKGKLVDTPVNREEAKKIVEERYEEQAKENFEDTLMASMRANPDMRTEIDDIVKNPDGTPKYDNQGDFMNQGSADAYLKIVESPLLDGLIQQGMTELGLPPQALREFTRKVKEKLGERLLLNYDVTKNDSLFGWLTGVSGGAGKSIIYRAKGDVMNEYKKEGQLQTVSIDAMMGENTSFEATLEAETDAFMLELEDMDMTARESDMVGPKKVIETIGLSDTSVNQIEATVEAAGVDITGLTYKDVKKLVAGKDAPLSSILEVIAREFGVDASRIVKPSDLNGKQRSAAQKFIKKNSSALLEMLPEGETRSGEATGVANTKLGDVYQKGDRLKFAEGASASGKFTQMKRSDISTAEFNEMFGIREDGTFDNNRKYDGAIKALVNQAAMVAANQSLRESAINKGAHPMSTIALLGDGKSEAMFSKKLRETSTSNPELGVYIIEKLKSKSGELYKKSGGNTRAVLENIFAEELANKTIPKSLITGLTKDVDRIAERFSNIPTKDIVFKGRPIGDVIVDQLEFETENARQYYKTIVANKIGQTELQSTTDPEYVGLFRTNVLGRISDDLGADFAMRYLFQGIAAPSKTGKGEYQFTSINEYELNPNYDPASADRKGVTEGAVDTKMVLKGEGVEVETAPSIATKGNLTSEDIDKKVKPNLERVVKFQQENNQAFRKVIDWLKAEYSAGRVSADEVVTMLELMNTNPKGLTRSSAILDFLPVDSFDGTSRLEHMTPALVVNLYALEHIMSNTSKAAQDFTNVMDNYRVAYLPQKYDDLINKYYKSTMPSYWTPDMPPLLRYYNPETHKFFDLKLEQLSTGDVIGPDFSIDQKAYDQAMDNKRAALDGFVSKDASNHDVVQAEKVVTEMMLSKRPTEPKGITVLDFDDTLATTKSNVLYTMPSESQWEFRADDNLYKVSRGTNGKLRIVNNKTGSVVSNKSPYAKLLSYHMMMERGATKLELENTAKRMFFGGVVPTGATLRKAPGQVSASTKLTAEEFAKQGSDLLAQGAVFDFSEFNKVVEGKTAPLFNKAMKLYGKFGADNMFILTARAPESQLAIKQFLDAQGLKIPLDNITGLGKSEASAKALWIAGKISEGYNDFYFADDAIQNVEAVQAMLDQHDVKGKVQQARLEFSKRAPKEMDAIIDEGAVDLDSDLNIILEDSKGVSRIKRFSAAKAKQRGKNKGKFKFFVPPSADDFAGLMYAFMGKGKVGDKHHAWFKKNLFDPFSKGMRRHKMLQQQVASDMKNLRKAMPDVRKKLAKKVPGTEYTHEDAIRIYNWSQAGLDIPGLSQADATALVNAVESDAKLLAFAQGVNSISNTPGGMADPGSNWAGGNIALDLKEALDKARGANLQQWVENKNIIFSEANMNKIEAVYGSNFREALEDSLYRMETGSTQNVGKDRLLNNFTAWIHGSIGTTMFLNARSAMLQMISNVNFVNWSDNNMVAAATAFANQPQYWKDVAMIFNSPFLKQRRSGIQTDVNAAELLAQIKDSKNKAKAATAYLLQLGFTPTQVADSFAIATGGATFYRNRIKTYVKEGMTQANAETKAFEDMMEIAEETQQSTRADKISQQQASPLGKFILAFQNTPMQYNRLIKKAAQDLVNGRGDPKANISRIVYYGGIQNLIFYGLQTALFAALFSDDEEDEITAKKTERVMNGMVDTLLRGSGIGGAVVSTVKNVILKFMKESEKMDDGVYYTDPDWGNVVIEGLNISPPIGIKARKIYSGLKTWEYNNDVIDHMSKTDLDNPIYDAVSSVAEAVTNVPLSRAYSKYQNISESLNAEHEMWKRVAMLLGWNKWSFGIKNQDVVTAKSEVKEIKAVKAEEKKEMKKVANEVERLAENEVIEEGLLLEQSEERESGQEDIKCAAVSRSGKRCGKKVKGGGNYCTIHESAPQRADGEKTQCTHLKSDGKRCKMKTTNQSGKCYYHD